MSLREKSYEVLPALSIRGRELRASLNVVTAGWMFGCVWMAIVGGAPMLNLGYLAGFSERHWGLLSALIAAATLMQLPASRLVEMTGLRKLQFLHSLTASRMLWLVIGLAPVALMLLHGAHGAVWAVRWLVLGVMLLSWVLAHLGTPAWTTWMADLIPARIRGRYWARRNIYTLLVQIPATLLVGWAVDLALDKQSFERLRDGELAAVEAPSLVWMLLGLFAVAAVLGTIDILLFRRVREIVRRSAPQKMSLWAILREPLSNRSFRNFVIAMGVLMFGAGLSAPFFQLNCQKVLGMDNTQTMLATLVCGQIGALLASQLWGRALDRWGRKPVLVLSVLGTIPPVWMWLLVTPATWWIGGVISIIGGAVWTGVFMARMNIELGFSSTTGRSTYTAATNVVLAAVGTVAGILGGEVAELARPFDVRIGPFHWVNYHVMFAMSGLFRCLSLIPLAGVMDPGAKPVGHVARQMAASLYRFGPALVFMPVRLLGWPVRLLLRVTPEKPAEKDRDAG